MQGAWVQSLLGEQRFHMPCSAAKKKKKRIKLNLELEPTNFFCEEPESKYIQDLKQYGFCCNFSALLYLESQKL